MVTIGIGGNDGQYGCSHRWDIPTCPFRSNFTSTLADLRSALDTDPGEETFEAMAYYNPASGSGGGLEASFDTGLLGANLAIGCSDRGSDAGLNDVIFQEAGRFGAPVADTYPAFKQGGQSFIADGVHANDAGHAAIANAFLGPKPTCEAEGPPEDADPPETTITKSPKDKSRKRKAKFRFTSDEPDSTFECKLDKKPFKPCHSPKKYKKLDPEKHRFRARATDPAGNTDPTPAKRKWKVKD